MTITGPARSSCWTSNCLMYVIEMLQLHPQLPAFLAATAQEQDQCRQGQTQASSPGPSLPVRASVRDMRARQ